MKDPFEIKLTRHTGTLAVEVSLRPGSESLESVKILLDGILINPERAQRHHRLHRYVREFRGVSDWFPGRSHQLEVTATDRDGRQSFASLCWNDEPTPVLT